MLPEPGEPAPPEPARAIDDPWPWPMPVGIWHGSHVTRMPRAHSDRLTANIPTAERFDYEGWHLPSDDVLGEIFSWLRPAGERQALSHGEVAGPSGRPGELLTS